MCEGLKLNSGDKCPHETTAGNCSRPYRLVCPQNADYCEICETSFDDENACECEESQR